MLQADIGEKHKKDWSGTPAVCPELLCRPKNTSDLSKIIKICHSHNQSIVIQGGMTGLADGGTRTASITGGCVALFLALKNHHDDYRAIKSHVAAVSLGILNNEVILDLDYNEDSSAETDLNLVMTENLELIEIQGTGEEAPFTKDQLNDMLDVGSSAIADIIEKQKACLE